jgi:DNA sulfur modification protein DndD
MRINRITLENFMPYYGKNVLNLQSPDSTPVILILGENGHGKTSIHHAIRWCLFGKTRPLKSDELIPPYKLLNWKSRSDFESQDQRSPQYREVKFSVQLEFEHLGQSYELKRHHVFVGSDVRGSEDVSLRIGDGNYVSGGKIKEVVEGVLSEELSQFFLFDGEVLDRFEEMRTQDQQAKFVKQQIESTLGIPKLKQAQAWVDQKVDEQFRLLKKSESQSKKESDLQERVSKDEELKRIKESERVQLAASLYKDQTELEKLKQILGNYEAIKKDLDHERELRSDIKSEEKSLLENINSLASLNKTLYWAPVADKLLQIQKLQNELKPVVLDLQKKRDSLSASISLHSELSKTGICPVCGSHKVAQPEDAVSGTHDLETQLEAVKAELAKYDSLFIHDSEQLFFTLEFSDLNYSDIRTLHKKISRLKESIARKKLELDLVLDRAPVSSVEVDQKDNLSRYEILARRVAQDEILLSNLDSEIETVKQQLSGNRSQLARSQTNTSTPVRVWKFYSNLTSLMEKTIEIYANNIRTKVEAESSKVFAQIISEKDFEALQINSMFGMEIKKSDGSLVSLRSEGQAHIAAISLVAGLLKTAIKDGFILMDTPFGRLDMTHREKICRWIVDSGLQVALFVHSGEFRMNEHMSLLAGRVGRAYQLNRIDSNRSNFQELN